MQSKKIGKELKLQVVEYLEHFWNETIGIDTSEQQKIIDLLSEDLKERLLREANRLSNFFKKCLFHQKNVIYTYNALSIRSPRV